MGAALEDFALSGALPDGTAVRALPHEAARKAARTLGLSLRLTEIEALGRGIIPERYLRNFKTLDCAAQARLLQARVALVGLGGLGGPILEGLARLGFGRIRAADHDSFEASNLNRQTLATEETLGRPKALAAQERMALVNPAVEFSSSPLYVEPQAFAEFFAGVDIAIDALGGLACRAAAERGAATAGVPLVTSAVAGWTVTVATVLPGATGLAALSSPDGSGSGAEDALGCLAPAIHVAVGFVLAECVRLALGRSPRFGGPDGQMAVLDLEGVTLDRFSLKER